MARSAPCFEFEVAVMDSPKLTSQAKVLYGGLRRLKKNGGAKVTLKKAVEIAGLSSVNATKAQKQLVAIGVIELDGGKYSFTLQKEGSPEQVAVLEKLRGAAVEES